MSLDLSVNVASMRFPVSEYSGNLIESLSFTVPATSIVTFLGRSGVGKTTLLRIIAGLERRFVGEVTIGGLPVLRPSRAVQIVFQDVRLLPWKTVYENVKFAMNRHGQNYDVQIDKWLALVGLQDKRNVWPKTLSGGEENRVAFVRTFIDPPKVLLLDEPFRNLDLSTRFSLQDELLKHLSTERTTVILVSHNIEEAVYLSDTVHLLSGRPMKIEATYNVDIERPRVRGDEKLIKIVGDITKYMAREHSKDEGMRGSGYYSKQ